jgi:hypothetical protein
VKNQFHNGTKGSINFLKIPSTGKRGSFKKKVGTRAGGFILKCKNLTIWTRVVQLFEFPKYGQFQLFI